MTMQNMNKTGRPSTYSQELADAICERLAEGESLRAVCRDDGMPNISTVLRWVIRMDEFRAQYARARDIGLDVMADEMLNIADTTVEGVRREESADGSVKEVREDMLGHRRLQVDARKWYLSKLAPKKYGERSEVELTVSGSLAERLARARARNDEERKAQERDEPELPES